MLIFPAVLSQYLISSPIGWLKATATWVGTYIANTTLWYYWAIYFILVVAFTYFYAYVVWQQQDIPNTLQKQGAHIPGYRPGETTRRHLNDILNRITLAGAIFLGIIAILPYISAVGGKQLLSSAAVLIAVVGALFYAEPFDPMVIVGAAVIFAGTYFSISRERG